MSETSKKEAKAKPVPVPDASQGCFAATEKKAIRFRQATTKRHQKRKEEQIKKQKKQKKIKNKSKKMKKMKKTLNSKKKEKKNE